MAKKVCKHFRPLVFWRALKLQSAWDSLLALGPTDRRFLFNVYGSFFIYVTFLKVLTCSLQHNNPFSPQQLSKDTDIILLSPPGICSVRERVFSESPCSDLCWWVTTLRWKVLWLQPASVADVANTAGVARPLCSRSPSSSVLSLLPLLLILLLLFVNEALSRRLTSCDADVGLPVHNKLLVLNHPTRSNMAINTRNTLDCNQSNVYSSRVVFSTISQLLKICLFVLTIGRQVTLPYEISFKSNLHHYRLETDGKVWSVWIQWIG